MSEIVIGIDLGTTNTCVSYYYNGKIKVLENKEGDRLTPSFVFFMENSRTVVGKYAKKLADTKPEYGIYEVKRLIGRTFNDLHVQNNLGYFSFQVVKDSNANDSLTITIRNKNDTIKKTPKEVCSLILKKIKQDVDKKLGESITKAVITVPAYFNVCQREATLEAAKLAGFNVLKLLNEPTASALTYFYDNNKNNTNYAIVYDLGGGTFDVAILKRTKNQIDIIGVDGDTHLGGHDFDKLLVDYVCDILEKEYKYNPRDNYMNMRRLLNECNEAKETLSTIEEASFSLIGFTNQPIVITLTRKDFEKLSEKLFKQTITIMDRCLKKSRLKKDEINEIILAGGSTRIPKIQQLISEYFDGRDLNQFIHPDECVAEGAALQAALLSAHDEQKIYAFTINDVTSLSLGIADFVDVMTVMIPRNSKMPTSCTVNRTTVYNKQTSIAFPIYEGERINAQNNYYLGTLNIFGITPAPPGQCEVLITMSVDQNGILTVTAKEELSNQIKDLKIDYNRGIRNDREIESIIIDAEINQRDDELFLKMAKIKGNLIKYCISIKHNLDKKKLNHKTIYDRCDEIEKIAMKFKVGDEERIKELTTEVEDLCKDIVKKYDFELMPVL